MNNDPDMWGDPENFRPERFLKEDGQLSKDLTLSFGFGELIYDRCICKKLSFYIYKKNNIHMFNDIYVCISLNL